MADLGEWPELGWSHSRSETLHRCARRYGMSYMAWQGWNAEMDADSWWMYRLGKLIGLPQLVGTLVHEAAREVVRAVAQGRERPGWKELYERGAAEINRIAGQELGAFLTSPKRFPLLAEALDGPDPLLHERVQSARDHLYECIVALLESDTLEEIARCGRDEVILTDTLDSIRYALADGETVTVWAAPDVAYWSPDREDTLVVVDWKTGRGDADTVARQLAAYALYVRYRHSLPPGTRLEGRVVALSPYSESTCEITDLQIAAARERIEADVALMRDYQADPATNEPVPMYEFAMPPAEERKLCRWCPYLAHCAPRQTADREATRGVAPVLPRIDVLPAGEFDFSDLLLA